MQCFKGFKDRAAARRAVKSALAKDASVKPIETNIAKRDDADDDMFYVSLSFADVADLPDGEHFSNFECIVKDATREGAWKAGGLPEDKDTADGKPAPLDASVTLRGDISGANYTLPLVEYAADRERGSVGVLRDGLPIGEVWKLAMREEGATEAEILEVCGSAVLARSILRWDLKVKGAGMRTEDKDGVRRYFASVAE